MQRHDVVIMGGGLAGLTLALQLKRRFDDIDVLVLERRAHPVPEAAHKVGESSVEIGAHYFEHVLGLGEHLRGEQLRKFGFRFFFSDGRRDIGNVTEVGASRYLSVPSYQIDRGIFENFLGEEAARRGVRFVDAAVVRRLALGTGGAAHEIEWERDGRAQSVQAGWLVDACGRAGLVKRKLGLAEPNAHDVNAVWFRIAGRIAVDDWCDDAAWQARCSEPRSRWLSTNHLCGAGYWAWLIPLASGSHSVGIVADEALHPLAALNTFDKAMEWLAVHQPRLHQALHDALDGSRDQLQDFAYLKHFSYGCKQVFSADRWALTGEAGLFLDPFYSPGSDFIAIANTYIAELIDRDRRGLKLDAHAQLYDQIFHSFYDSTLALYQDQYPLFGDPEVLPVKVIWDYAYYWGVLAQIYFQHRLADLAALGRLRAALAECQQLNRQVQDFLRAWGQVSAKRNRPVMIDHAAIPWFAELNRSLTDTLDGPAFDARLRASAALLRGLAGEIVALAQSDHPALAAGPLQALADGVDGGARWLPSSIDARRPPAADQRVAEPRSRATSSAPTGDARWPHALRT